MTTARSAVVAAFLAASTAASTSSAGSGSPLARLVPRSPTGPRVACPLSIVPGVSLGFIALGETLDDLKRGGVIVSNVSDSHADVAVPGRADPGTALKVSLCQGKIIEIWMDDLRLGSSCVTYDGKPIANAIGLPHHPQRGGDEDEGDGLLRVPDRGRGGHGGVRALRPRRVAPRTGYRLPALAAPHALHTQA